MSLYLFFLGFSGSFESVVPFNRFEKSSAIISLLYQPHPHSSLLGLQWNVCWTFLHVINLLFSVFHVFAFQCCILDSFLWSNLWFLILSSIVFNLLPNTSIEILLLLNFSFLEVIFDSLLDLLGHFVQLFFPCWDLQTCCLLTLYLKLIQVCYCSHLFMLVLIHMALFPYVSGYL